MSPAKSERIPAKYIFDYSVCQGQDLFTYSNIYYEQGLNKFQLYENIINYSIESTHLEGPCYKRTGLRP